MTNNTPSSKFFLRAVVWLRAQPTFSTRILPEHQLEQDAPGVTRVLGWRLRPSSFGIWDLVGFYVLVLGAVLAMLNLPNLDVDPERSINRAGYAMAAAAAGCLAAGEVTRRRNRTRALVELRAGPASATPATVADLRKAAHDAEAWVVSEHPFAPDTLRAAAQAGVRCYVERPDSFEEVEPTSRPGAEAQRFTVGSTRRSRCGTCDT